MPTYTYYNNKTDEMEEHFMKISEKDEFEENNPHLESRIVACPPIIAGVTVHGSKLPDAFRDRLRLAKQKNPLSKGLDHLI